MRRAGLSERRKQCAWSRSGTWPFFRGLPGASSCGMFLAGPMPFPNYHVATRQAASRSLDLRARISALAPAACLKSLLLEVSLSFYSAASVHYLYIGALFIPGFGIWVHLKPTKPAPPMQPNGEWESPLSTPYFGADRPRNRMLSTPVASRSRCPVS